jgi:hypothetical protein
MVIFNSTMWKTHEKNFLSVILIEIIENLMAADLVSVFQCAHAVFLRKFLILLHYLNLKTSTEDSRLRIIEFFSTCMSTISKKFLNLFPELIQLF